MSWVISGIGHDLIFKVSERTYPSCHGAGLHECLPPQDDYNPLVSERALRRVQEAQVQWSLYLSDDLQSPLVQSFAQLSENLSRSPAALHFMTTFIADSPTQVEFSFFAPAQAFEHIQKLLQCVLQNDALAYTISVPFVGLPVEGSATSLPTWDEFIAGKPFIDSGYNFTTRQKRDDA